MTLREWLFKKNITKTKFAKMMGCDRSHLHRVLQGTRAPSQDLINKVLELTEGEVNLLKFKNPTL
jgi:transcriptional regulator with XRE-family HTH domain